MKINFKPVEQPKPEENKVFIITPQEKMDFIKAKKSFQLITEFGKNLSKTKLKNNQAKLIEKDNLPEDYFEVDGPRHFRNHQTKVTLEKLWHYFQDKKLMAKYVLVIRRIDSNLFAGTSHDIVISNQDGVFSSVGNKLLQGGIALINNIYDQFLVIGEKDSIEDEDLPTIYFEVADNKDVVYEYTVQVVESKPKEKRKKSKAGKSNNKEQDVALSKESFIDSLLEY